MSTSMQPDKLTERIINRINFTVQLCTFRVHNRKFCMNIDNCQEPLVSNTGP